MTTYPNDDYTLWCKAHNCEHAHCPLGCEHPQPYLHNGELICGRCAIIDHVRTLMVPCNEAIC